MAATKKAQAAFTKKSIMESARYAKYIDVVEVVLDNDKEYTHDQVETKINDFLEMKVR